MIFFGAPSVFVSAQEKNWEKLPPFPEKLGRAGMNAGVSGELLFCMGGTNFPDKMPWKGGKKKWYDDIYVLRNKKWIRLNKKLSRPLAYGVSVSYNNKIIIAGGNDSSQDLSQVVAYLQKGDDLQMETLPELLIPLSYATGGLVGDLFIVAGGKSKGLATNRCFVMDLNNISKGWVELDPIPGKTRSLALSTSYQGNFYLFGGETDGITHSGTSYSEILQDAYVLEISNHGDRWKGNWHKLAPMPKAMAAGGFPLPVLQNGDFFFWGGIDGVSALHKNPETEVDVAGSVLLYHPASDTWDFGNSIWQVPAAVTLPVVHWKDKWVYISGEIRAGVRTLSVTAIK